MRFSKNLGVAPLLISHSEKMAPSGVTQKGAPSTTTLSTIVLKSKETQVVIALLRCGSQINLKVKNVDTPLPSFKLIKIEIWRSLPETTFTLTPNIFFRAPLREF